MFTLDEFRDATKAGIKKVLKKKEEIVLGDDDDFGDYGLDSLTGISLVLEVESALDIDLGEFDIDEANTIKLFYAKVVRVLEEYDS
ncbi:MAG: acyl carrier protein [Halioglobus sp.]|jgi:acyl carrier protein